MKDYRLEIRIKNNHLFKKMEAFGIKSLPELAEKSGANYSSIIDIAALKLPIMKKVGGARKAYIELAEFFGCLPTDLAPEKIMYEGVKTNRVDRDVNEVDLALIDESIGSGQSLLEDYSKKECTEAIDGVLDTLTEREKKIIEWRFYDRLTLEECGKKEGVCRERIRSIEQRALRKMQHPSRSKLLCDYVFDFDSDL